MPTVVTSTSIVTILIQITAPCFQPRPLSRDVSTATVAMMLPLPHLALLSSYDGSFLAQGAVPTVGLYHAVHLA